MIGPTHSPILVVISHYNVRPLRDLVALLDQIALLPAGWPLKLRIVVNLAEPKRLLLPARHRNIEVHYRQNTGYNIGAWDHGWRQEPSYDAYLFLQEECRLVRADWAKAFVMRSLEPGIGLVGESLSPDWDAPWDELQRRTEDNQFREQLIDGRPAQRVPCYLDFFHRHAIPAGPKGDHLQSLILFARHSVLQAMGGFPIGDNFGEAIAAEIGISKKVQARGLRICEVGPSPFHYIEHPQWLHRRSETPR